MKLTGLYVWSIQVEVEVPEDATDEQKREVLDNAAMESELDFKHPILHECSDPRLID